MNNTLSAHYIDHMGDDLAVVNAARVSFDKESEWEWENTYGTSLTVEGSEEVLTGGERKLSAEDIGLIHFLARGCASGEWESKMEYIWEAANANDLDGMEKLILDIKRMPAHWVPFAATCIKIRMRAPIPITRQAFKHKVGLVESEISRRYVSAEPEFHVMDYRVKPTVDVKQGSGGIHPENQVIQGVVGLHRDKSRSLYNHLIDIGVCSEQARMELPQAMVTEWVWTGSLYAYANFCKQRLSSHAQQESSDLAQAVSNIIEPLFPECWLALSKY